MAARFLRKTYRIIEATVPAEYNELSDNNKDRYKLIISAGLIDFSDDTTVKSALWAMFPEGTDTRVNLEALESPPAVEE